ncbi:hypothetical protein B0H14DRAFT_2811579 [Mycena olivaceomarginata]|nr:hypothetical protein B0H14DRAFT_2811579 [Mycena olivaceomarginata]
MHPCLAILEIVETICNTLTSDDCGSLLCFCLTILFVPLPDGARISQASQRVWKMQRPFLATDWSGTSPYAPRVKILDLRYTPPHRFVQLTQIFPLLSALTTSCPGLRHVSMDFQPTSDEVDTAISLFVCGLQHLQSLSMRIPTMAAMQRVAQLPGMTSLSLIEFPHAFTPSGCIDPPIFSHLRRLSLGPIDIELAIKFFASLSHTPFTSLVVRLTTCPPTEAMDSLFHALQTACVRENLESFRLQNHTVSTALPPAQAQESHIITGCSLGVLACFPNIRTVSILWPVGFDLDDAALPQLVAAWPHIEWLELRGSLMDLRPRITLQSLHSLARICPQMCFLAIEFDAESAPVPSLKGEVHVVQNKLTLLDVACSSISASAPVARYLSSLFPNLSGIVTVGEDDYDDDTEEVEHNPETIARQRLWKEVEAQIPEFVAAREEEHAWAH